MGIVISHEIIEVCGVVKIPFGYKSNIKANRERNRMRAK